MYDACTMYILKLKLNHAVTKEASDHDLDLNLLCDSFIVKIIAKFYILCA